jgi:uncharacterized protein YggE
MRISCFVGCVSIKLEAIMKTLMLAAVLICGQIAVAQNIQVNQQNKTIAVTAEESVSVDAEIAIVHIGFHNYGSTRDMTYQNNVDVADAITKALLNAHITKQNIETEKLQLTAVNPDLGWTPEMKKDRAFEAKQSWKVTVEASKAQGIVDLAVRNGANELEDAEWEVDPAALEAKASGAAVAKARSIAEQMAKGLGTALGELIYASNQTPIRPGTMRHWLDADVAYLAEEKDKTKLTLFPEKVGGKGTVYAVFAIR